MGGFQSKKPIETTPIALPYDKAKQLVNQTSQLLTMRKQIKFWLKLTSGTIVYNQRDWRKSNVHATIQKDNKAVQNKCECIVLDLEQVYKINQLLRQIKKNTNETPGETPTPLANEEDHECCICFDEKATTVLPCTHSYCANCTTKYIIERDEHRCPQCRMQFAGNKQTIKRSFYELIEQDRIIFDQARRIIIEYLQKYNIRVVNLLNLKQQK